MLDSEEAARKEKEVKKTNNLLGESVVEKNDDAANEAQQRRPIERNELYEDLIKDPKRVSEPKNEGFLSIDEKLSLFF